MRAAGRSGRKWQRAVREHRAALSSFVEFASGIDAAAWELPLADGKWSPAEVTEHLALAYVAALAELAGGPALAPRLSPARQTLLRWLLVPHMLFHRSVPRARAPREIRPAAPVADRATALARLLHLGQEFEAACALRPQVRLTHPYFGSVDRATTVRLLALHIEHHQRTASAALTTDAPAETAARA